MVKWLYIVLCLVSDVAVYSNYLEYFYDSAHILKNNLYSGCI